MQHWFGASMIARVLLRLTLLAATITWMTWGYLQTIGDPARGPEIAAAILDDPEARHELAAPIVTKLRFSADVPEESVDALTRAVADALGDPAISGQIVSVFSSVHAQTLGVPDDGSTTIDIGALSAAIHERLDATAPQIAARIPNDIDVTVDLPVLQIPHADNARSLAETIVRWMALLSIGAAVTAFVIGERRYVLMRVGIWGVSVGLLTVAATKIWIFGARIFLPGLDAAVRNGVGAATRDIVDMAWLLVIAGVPLIGLSFFFMPVRREERAHGRTAAAPTSAAEPAGTTAPPEPAARQTQPPQPPREDLTDPPSWTDGSEVPAWVSAQGHRDSAEYRIRERQAGTGGGHDGRTPQRRSTDAPPASAAAAGATAAEETPSPETRPSQDTPTDRVDAIVWAVDAHGSVEPPLPVRD